MFGFLGYIFIVGLFIFLIIISIAIKVVNGIFRTGKRMAEKMTSSQPAEEQPPHSRPSEHTYPQRKKIFDSDEGEYIDFEEIKD